MSDTIRALVFLGLVLAGAGVATALLRWLLVDIGFALREGANKRDDEEGIPFAADREDVIDAAALRASAAAMPGAPVSEIARYALDLVEAFEAEAERRRSTRGDAT